MVTDIYGRRTHSIVADGLLGTGEPRTPGAAGAEPNSGDGAGILIQLPDELFRAATDFALPAPSASGAKHVRGGWWLPARGPRTPGGRRAAVTELAQSEGITVLGWRDLPVDPRAMSAPPHWPACRYMSQLCVTVDPSLGHDRLAGIDLDRDLSVPQTGRTRHAGDRGRRYEGLYFPSLSSRTIVYKGMLTTMQLPLFYDDLRDERCLSAIAIVHSRFSTNTFPSWPLAHPFRFVAHNGEIKPSAATATGCAHARRCSPPT